LELGTKFLLAPRQAGHLVFDISQMSIGWHDKKVFFDLADELGDVQDGSALGQKFVSAERRFALPDPETAGRVPLGIHIYNEDFFMKKREASGEIDTRRCFAATALQVSYCKNPQLSLLFIICG
jgi:hypothetical protein